MRGHHVTVLELHAERRIRQGLHDLAFHLQCIFFGHRTFLATRKGPRIYAQTGRAMQFRRLWFHWRGTGRADPGPFTPAKSVVFAGPPQAGCPRAIQGAAEAGWLPLWARAAGT